MDSIWLYNKIIKLARLKGMTEPDLYKKAGISDGTLRTWKSRGSLPSLYVLEGLCFALDINLARLFSDDDCQSIPLEYQELIELFDTLSKSQRQAVINLVKSFSDS